MSGGGYNIQHIPNSMEPQAPEREYQLWYQFYLHSERGRAGLERNRHELCKLPPGDPAAEATERQLIERPPIAVPTIVLHRSDNGVIPLVSSKRDRRFFAAAHERRVIPAACHNLSQEAPREFAAAVLSLVSRAEDKHLA